MRSRASRALFLAVPFFAIGGGVVSCGANDERKPSATSLTDALTCEGLAEGAVPVCLDGTSKPSGAFIVRNVSDARVTLDMRETGVFLTSSVSTLEPGASANIRLELIEQV